MTGVFLSTRTVECFVIVLTMQLVWLVMQQHPRPRERNPDGLPHLVPHNMLYTPEIVRSLAAIVEEEQRPADDAGVEADAWFDSLQPLHRHACGLALVEAGHAIGVSDELSPSELIVRDDWKVFVSFLFSCFDFD